MNIFVPPSTNSSCEYGKDSTTQMMTSGLALRTVKPGLGVGDYLQKTSGDVALIEVAKPDSTVEKGKELGTMESAKTTIALLSPMSRTLDEATKA